ncbi:MAG: ABC transporter substrate-binding protein, partial [Microvirga sp.]
MTPTFRSAKAWIVAGALTLVLASPALAQQADPKWDSWLQKSQLGPYQKNENWDEVVTNAKKEGEVVVYSSSGTMLKVAEDFAKFYPEIKVKAYDLGSEKTIEKVVREHQAGVY